jgi:ParB/RepB/Spo0J family partition protein
MGKFSVQNIRESAARASKSTDELKLVPKLEYVRCDKIEFHPNNRFAEYDNEQDIRDIADDIAINGIMHTIVVNKRGKKYRILSGEKRFRAALLLKKETVPCNVYNNLDDETEMRILYSANLQVRTYPPAKILQFYNELNDMLTKQKNEGKYNGSITAGIAKIMKISERQVRKYARICGGLDSEHLKSLFENRLSINDADKLLKHEKTEPVPLSPTAHEKTEPVPLSPAMQKNGTSSTFTYGA